MARIEVDTERCKGCGLCVEACKEECIAPNGEINSSGWVTVVFINPDKCKGCAMCAEVCPDMAIEVFK